MSWNDGYERSQFKARQKELIAEYRAAGMTQEQIEEICLFDFESYKSDRRYATHTQHIPVSDDFEVDTQNPLISIFFERFTTAPKPSQNDKFWWIEEISNTLLCSRIKMMSERDKEFLTLIVCDALSQKELAQHYRTSQQMISVRINRIRQQLLPYAEKIGGELK